MSHIPMVKQAALVCQKNNHKNVGKLRQILNDIV